MTGPAGTLAAMETVGRMGTSLVVAWTDGAGVRQMAEVRSDGTIGAHIDAAHFERNLGGYIGPVTGTPTPAQAATIAAGPPETP